MLFFIILICNEISGFTVLDTTLLNHYSDFKVDINSSNYEGLLKIPYVDSEKALSIIKDRKKWGSIIDRRMFAYILGRENADLIAPYVIYNKPKIGFCPETDISINNGKTVVDFSLLYERRGFKSFLFYDVNDKLLRFYSEFNRKGYKFIIGNYTTSLSFLAGGKYPFRVYKYRSEKRNGIAISKQSDNYSLLLSGKYGRISINDSCFKHLKTELFYFRKFGQATITAVCHDSLLFHGKEKSNNLTYDLVINGGFSNINNSLRFDIKGDKIKTRYQNYYGNKHVEFYNNICFYSAAMEDQLTYLLLSGRFRKNNLAFDYYLKNEYWRDSTCYHYKLRFGRTDLYGNVKFVSGVYSVSRNDYTPSNSVYPNFLTEIDLAGTKTGFFLNIMTSMDSTYGIKGELFSGFLDYFLLPNLRISLSSIMFNVENDYHFENIADKYSGTGSLSSRGIIFKGALSFKTNVADCNLSFYIKKNPLVNEKAKIIVSHVF